MRVLAIIFSIFCSPVVAHEFWIEPMAYQIGADGKLRANLVNGEEFDGMHLAYLPQRFANFVIFNGQDSKRVDGRPGDIPALDQAPIGDGLHIAAYQARRATLRYDDWAKFQKFIDHKDLGDVLPVHRARGLPEERFTEVYSRYSKALFGVGDAGGSDRRVGLETELVALDNPYTDDLSAGFRVQLHYRDTFRSNEQIEVFERAADGAVAVMLYRTDEQGIGTFPVKPGHDYMVDAVVLREPPSEVAEATGAVWQTLWANLTFAVPE